ncbi:MAG: putative transport system permease protein [Patescibacteria group bacterium]|nr:putative transport system permease protein [Patescibacteria group bacterium]
MHFLLINHIQNARQSLHSSRVRSLLTMLGISIGVCSVTIILALSGGINKLIETQVESLGGNIVVIRPGVDNNITDLNNIQPQQKYTTSTLTENDIKYAQNTNHVQATAPIMILSGSIKADSTAPNNSLILATTPSLLEISNLKIKDGQFLSDNINKKTAVIGGQLSINIFGTESSIGKIITIRGQQFTVIGILKRTNNPVNYNSIDFDNAVIINFSDGKGLNSGVAQIQQINIKADNVSNLNDINDKLNKAISASHKGEKDFSVLIGDQILKPTSTLFRSITGVIVAVAAISLIVGGIGIMNIMLVTVAERTREIGIRKALGATNSDISWQFLIESLAISISGGIIGYISGYIIAFFISNFLIFNPVFNWQIAVIAFVISVITGTLFGIYPAIRAAHKDPIVSLHRYN